MAGKFVAQLWSMGHQARVKAVQTHPDPVAIIAELTKEEPTHKSVTPWVLAIALAAKTKDSNTIKRALFSRSHTLSSSAAKMVHLALSKDEIIEVVLSPELSVRSQAVILNKIIANNVRNVAVPLFDKLKESKAGIKLLGLCDETRVSANLPALPRDAIHWQPIVRNHPTLILNKLSYITVNPQHHFSLYWEPFGLLIRHKITNFAIKVLQLVLDNCPEGNLPVFITQNNGFLIKRFPQEMATLLSNPLINKRSLDFVKKRLRYFSTEQREAILEKYKQDFYSAAGLLHALPFEQRAHVFNCITDNKPLTVEELPPSLLQQLPSKIRVQETKRMLELPKIKTHHAQTISLSQYLDMESGKQVLVPETKRSEASERMTGWNHLINLHGYNRAPVTELLQTMATRLKNEQGPVREAAISTFANLPVTLFNPEILPNIAVLVKITLEAQDSSDLNGLVRIFNRIIQRGTDTNNDALVNFSLENLRDLAVKRGYVPLTEQSVPKGKEKLFFDTFIPLIEDRMRTADTNMLQIVMRALGKKSRNVEQAGEYLYRAIKLNYSPQFVHMYLNYAANKEERFLKLFNEDESVITAGNTYECLLNRVDLVTKFLDKNHVMEGKYWQKAPCHWVFPTAKAATKWTPEQQALYIDDLKHTIELSKTNFSTQRTLLERLVNVPATSVADLNPYLSAEANVRNIALQVLKDVDDKVPTVDIYAKSLNGDDAKISMFALSKVLKHISYNTATEMVLKLLKEAKKITVIKELIRLLLELQMPNTEVILNTMLQQPNVHRDVRITIIKGLVDFLNSRVAVEHVVAWNAIEAAVESEDEDGAIAISTLFSPNYMATPHRQRYGRLLLKLFKNKNLKVRQTAVGFLGVWSEELPFEIAQAAQAIVLDFKDINLVSIAIRDMLIPATQHKLTPFFFDTCKLLVDYKNTDEDFASLTYDLPNLQRIGLIVGQLESKNQTIKAALKPVIDQLVELFKSDSRFWGQYASCRLMNVDWQNVTETIAILRDLAVEANGNYARTKMLLSRFVRTANTNRHKLNQVKEIIVGLQKIPDMLALKSLVYMTSLEGGWKEHTLKMLKDIRLNADESTKLVALSTFVNPIR